MFSDSDGAKGIRQSDFPKLSIHNVITYLWERRIANHFRCRGQLLGLLEHPEERKFRTLSRLLIHFHPWLEIPQAIPELLHGVHFHVAAVGAGAAIRGTRNEILVRAFPFQPMEHAALGDDDDVLHWCVLAEMNHFLRGANLVGQQPHRLSALGMCDDQRIGILRLDPIDRIPGELNMDITSALPQIHLPPGLFHYPCAQIRIRHEKDGTIRRRQVDNFHRVPGGADDIAERLHPTRAIDVGDDVVVLFSVLLQVGLKLIGGARLLQRAASIFVGQHHGFRRVDDLRGLGHEMNAAEDDHLGIRGFRLVGEPEGIAYIIGDILDVPCLVIVSQDNCVPSAFQFEDFPFQIQGGLHGGISQPMGGNARANRPSTRDLRTYDFHKPAVLGSSLDHQPPGTGKPLQVRLLLKHNRSGTRQLRFHVAVDVGLLSTDITLKFDLCPALHPEFGTTYVTNNLAMAPDPKNTGTIDRRSEFPQNRKIMALNLDSDDRPFLEYLDVPTGLDAPPPGMIDFVICEADVSAALRALAGLGGGNDIELVAAMVAFDRARWTFAMEYFPEKTGACTFLALHRHLGSTARRRVLERRFPRARKPGRVFWPDHRFAIPHIHMLAARPAKGGYHHGRFHLAMFTSRTDEFDVPRVQFNPCAPDMVSVEK